LAQKIGRKWDIKEREKASTIYELRQEETKWIGPYPSDRSRKKNAPGNKKQKGGRPPGNSSTSEEKNHYPGNGGTKGKK